MCKFSYPLVTYLSVECVLGVKSNDMNAQKDIHELIIAYLRKDISINNLTL